MADEVDLGQGHKARFFVWDPDMSIQSNAEKFADAPGSPEDPVGAIIEHPSLKDGSPCSGSIHFDTPRTSFMSERNRWQLVSLDPLHVEPSILCNRCGDHGFIRNGRWETA